MPTVPYTPFATAEPQSGVERLNVATPPAAFGVNIAQAVEGLGQTGEKVGDELFTRAMALQELRNEADAREAQSQYAEKASLLHAQYGSLEGKAAVDALPGYIQSQKDLRTQLRGSLKTQIAQKLYDADTLPFMQRNVFSAAGHAADQNKSYVVGTAEANMDIAAKTFVNPKDETEFDHKLRSIENQAQTVAAAKGMSDAQLQDYILNKKSNLRLGQIVQTAHDDPQFALKMLDEHKQELTQPADYDKALQVARAQNRAVGGVNLVNSVYSPDKTATQMEQEIKDQSPALAHNDPLFEKEAIQALKGKIYSDRTFQREDNNTAMQKVYDAMQHGVKDVRELRLMPGMASTVDSLSPAQREKIPAMINSYNAAKDKAAHEDNYTALTGMYYNDREAFLDADFTKYDLSQSQLRDLWAKRAQAVKKPSDDPMLNRAMGWMRQSRAAELRALGIYYRPTQGADATDYDHYTGAMQAAIDAWREEKGSPPGFKDIVETIGPAVIHQRDTPSTIFGMAWPTKRAAYDQDLSAAKEWAEKKGLAQQIQDRGGIAPTDEEIYRAFIRSQFIDLYSKEKPVGGPSVPQSK